MYYYTKREYYFEGKDDMRLAIKWFRDNKVKNWYFVPRFLPGPKSTGGPCYYIIAKFNYTETDKMMVAEFKFG